MAEQHSNISSASPGPWRVEESHTTSVHGTRCVAYVVSDKTNIADVCDSYNISTEEALANARLIAAAPDMATALRDAYYHLRKDYNDDAPVMAAALAALKKAGVPV